MTIPVNFEDKNTDSNIPARWWIEIEGIRKRYSSWLPAWNPADSGTNRPLMDYMADLVQFDAWEIEPLNGSAKPGGFTVELLDVDDELTALAGVANRDAVTVLTAALAVGGNTITVKDSSVFSYPRALYLDAETVWAFSAPTGTTIFLGSGPSRGMFGSTDAAHDLTDVLGNPRSVELRDTPPMLMTREVLLYESRQGLAEVDSIVVRGTLDDIQEHDGVWTLQCSGMLHKLSTMIGESLATTNLTHPLWDGLADEDRNLDRSDNEASSDWCAMCVDIADFQSQGVFQVGDELIYYTGKDTATWPNYHLLHINHDGSGGHTVHPLWPYYSTVNRGLLSEAILGATGTISFWTTRPFFMSWHDRWADVRECISWHWLSEWFSPLHLGKTRGLDPITVALALMTSTGLGTNGDYDQLPAGWGAGIPVAQIDVEGMEALRDRYGLGAYECKFVINESVDLGEWLTENIFRPCLLYPRETLDGKIGLGRLMTKNEAAQEPVVLTVDEDVLLAIPRARPTQMPFGEFTWVMNYYPPTDTFWGKVKVILGHGSEKYKARAKRFELECRTLYDHRYTSVLNGTKGGGAVTFSSGSLGEFPPFLRQFIEPIAQRFSENPCPILDFPVPYNRWTQVQPGMVIRLTCSVVPNAKTGARGMVAELCQVISAKPNPTGSEIALEVWQIGVHDDNYHRVAPSAKVLSYAVAGGAGGKPRITLDPIWTADDAALFIASQFILLLDDEYVALDGTANPEVVATGEIGVNTIDLKAVPIVAPGPGDWIETPMYDDSGAALKAAWAYLADANGQLGAANDDEDVRL